MIPQFEFAFVRDLPRVRPTAEDARKPGFDWDGVTGMDLVADLELARLVSSHNKPIVRGYARSVRERRRCAQ